MLLDAGEGSDLGWRVPLIELLEGGWPWLLLFPIALLGAWRGRQSRWGYWSLGTLTVLAAAILPLRTQLPWYSHPLWLPFALLCAPLLAWVVNRMPWPSGTMPMRKSCLSSLHCGQALGASADRRDGQPDAGRRCLE